MLDLRLVWDDSAPCLLACSGGLRYVLLQASVVHHLPVVSHADLHVLLEAIHVFTETGVLWDARQWSQKLGRKLSLYHWGAPITFLPNEHADFTEDPQVNFTAMRSPLPTSSHLHSSTVTFEDLDEEEDRKERTLMTGAKSSTTTTDVLHHRTLPTHPLLPIILKTVLQRLLCTSLLATVLHQLPRQLDKIRVPQMMPLSCMSRLCLLPPTSLASHVICLRTFAILIHLMRVLFLLALVTHRVLPPQL